MASTSTVIGVSSIFHSKTTTSCRRVAAAATTTATNLSSAISLSSSSASFLSEKPPHFNSLIAKTQLSFRHSLIINNNSTFTPSAIATPNPILSEEAFKGLDGFSDLEADADTDDALDYDSSETELNSNTSEDELDISKLGLPHRLVQTLQNRGITHLFPIQRAVLIPTLEGRDLIARAKTGTGKTLAFGIPIIKRLTEDAELRGSQRRTGRLPKALVLAPTRELAKQVEKEIKESAPYLSTVCVYGGVSYATQQNALSRGVDVVVGTPGRIIDLLKGNSLKLGEVEYLVLDEADQMLSFGFEEDVEVILESLPSKRQSMLFSATMPTWVKKLARKYLDNPLQIDLVGDREEKLAEGIKLYAISTTATSKRTILSDLVTVYAKGGKTIIFTRTKRDADEVSMALTQSIASEALHGDISQHQRERTLNGFRQGKFTVLVATDVASRGLDIPNVDLIIHYELPNDPETFVHRSGRTGRAGKEGTAILMFTNSQRRTVRSLERDAGCKFEFASPPAIEELLESSAEQVVATLKGVHADSVEFFTPTAQKLIEEQGTSALAAALAHLSGFSRPPSSRSLISHEQGWTTLQLTRDPTYSSGFLSARSVTGFLSDVYPAAADEVGKIHLIADERVRGALFDLPEEIAKELLNKQLPPGNTITKITKLPALQDDGPPSDFYGRFSSRDRPARGGPRGQRGGFRSSHGWGSGRDSDDEGMYRRGGRSNSNENSRSRMSRSSGDDWLVGGRRSSRPSSRDRSFGGSCFNCGRPGHRVKIDSAFEDICLEHSLLLASVDIRMLPKNRGTTLQHPEQGKVCTLIRVFGSLRGINRLSLSNQFLEFLANKDVPERLATPFNSLLALELKEIRFASLKGIAASISILRSSPNLKDLLVTVYPCDEISKPVMDLVTAQLQSDFYFDQLKVVKIRGIIGTRIEWEFLRLILAHSPVLESMTIVKFRGERFSESFLQEVGRASNHVKFISLAL